MNLSSIRAGLCLRSWVLLSVALVLLPAALMAQSYFGDIVGTVTDPTGAAIPNAVITVTNSQTGAVFHTTANSYGYYAVRALIPDVYSVKVSTKGFQSTVVTPVKIEVAQTVTVNATLKVGMVTQ
ncbi:MAG: carboxypeptidase-like regulatory domain-containing protein, partial [Terriglobia bacterium]